MPSAKSLLLDRDGVIIRDVHLLQDEKDIELAEGICELINTAIDQGYKIFMVTNQTVISRGILSFDEAISLNKVILKKLEERVKGFKFDGVYLCPHHPNATVEKYRIDCDCRKPKPGMLLTAAREHKIDLSNSYFVGDRISDVVAGNLANCKTVLLDVVNAKKKLIESNLEMKNENKVADLTINSLEELERIIKG